MKEFKENLRKHNLLKFYLGKFNLQMVSMVVVDESVCKEIADFYFSLWGRTPPKEYFHIPTICRKEDLVFTEIEADFLSENLVVAEWINTKRKEYITHQKNELKNIFEFARSQFE